MSRSTKRLAIKRLWLFSHAFPSLIFLPTCTLFLVHFFALPLFDLRALKIVVAPSFAVFSTPICTPRLFGRFLQKTAFKFGTDFKFRSLTMLALIVTLAFEPWSPAILCRWRGKVAFCDSFWAFIQFALVRGCNSIPKLLAVFSLCTSIKFDQMLRTQIPTTAICCLRQLAHFGHLVYVVRVFWGGGDLVVRFQNLHLN